MDKHPYVNAMGHLVQVTNHLRKSFPQAITAETLRKLGFAPQNESYVLNVLRFLDLIDQEGKKTERASIVFSIHEDDKFAVQFSRIVQEAYRALFELHGEEAWKLDTNALISFFRTADGSTALVGKLQANTFQRLSAISGYGAIPAPKATPIKSAVAARPKGEPVSKNQATRGNRQLVTTPRSEKVGLTVRIEINLPADGSQETYDRIFKSIRANLLNE